VSTLTLAHLRVNLLSREAFGWYKTYLAAIDARDVNAYVAFLADEATMQFNNEAPIVGKDSVLAMLGGYWQSYAGLTHDLRNIYGDDQRFALEALNHYRRHDGKPVTIRAVAFTDRNEAGLVTSVRVYADASPVFA
jgi:ketosteroid isomerase-like protein